MRLHFVTVPIHGSTAAEEELNQFLATHRVIAVDRQLVTDGARSAWAICVTYVDAIPGTATDASGRKRIDYREQLPDAEFQVFAKLRDLRKQLAEREGVPPYAVFTNEQLAEMVRRHVRSGAELQRIDGIGPARLEKYGRPFLEILRAAAPVVAGPPGPPAPSAVPVAVSSPTGGLPVAASTGK